MKGRITVGHVVDSIMDVAKIEDIITLTMFKDERNIELSWTQDNANIVIGLLERAKLYVIESIGANK